MTGIATHGVFAPGLSTRGPVSSVLEECLSAQLRARPRGPIARFFGLSPLHPDARSRYRAAVGELQSATVFSQLGPTFTVLEPVTETDAGPEHLIVGPPGLFTVTVRGFTAQRIRADGPRFLINGHKAGHVANALRDAGQVSHQLSDTAGTHIEVTPLIVVVDPASLTLKTPQVAVTESVRVARWFLALPRTLSDETIEYLSTVAGSPGSWRVCVDVGDDSRRRTRRFDRLRHEVETARRRSRIWVFGSVSVLAGGVVAVLAAFAEPLLGLVGLA
jgi:hypothetical protein